MSEVEKQILNIVVQPRPDATVPVVPPTWEYSLNLACLPVLWRGVGLLEITRSFGAGFSRCPVGSLRG
jgi:hypothetical protein